MAREWSERHIRDLVRSEWVKIEGGGGGGDDEEKWADWFVKMMEDYVYGSRADSGGIPIPIADGTGLKGFYYDYGTYDYKPPSVNYKYTEIGVHVDVTSADLTVTRNVGGSVDCDVSWEYEGYLSFTSSEDMYPNCNGWISPNGKLLLPEGYSLIHNRTYYLGSILYATGLDVVEYAYPVTDIIHDKQTSSGRYIIDIPDTGEEFLLRTYASDGLPHVPGSEWYGIVPNKAVNTGHSGKRNFSGSGKYQVSLLSNGVISRNWM